MKLRLINKLINRKTIEQMPSADKEPSNNSRGGGGGLVSGTEWILIRFDFVSMELDIDLTSCDVSSSLLSLYVPSLFIIYIY